MTRRTGLAVLVAATALAGCGGSLGTAGSPSTSTSPRTATTSPTAAKLAQAQRTHEYPATPHPAQRTASEAATPIAAIRAFATAYINWNAANVSAKMRELAARSVDQARAAAQMAAADTAQDYELRRGGIANSGIVEAIAALRGSRTRFVVVTLERTTATNTTAYQGLKPAWHVALAVVIETSPGNWVLSGWQPES